MKGMWTFFQTFLVFLCTVAVVFAEEAKGEAAGDPYAAVYWIWRILIGIILVWGAYDSFWRPID